MYLPLLFWLALLIPGYVAVRRCAPAYLEAGLPATIAVSYLATFALLSPISILGYLFAAPLVVLSTACVILVLLGITAIAWYGWWRELGRLALLALGVESFFVAVDLVLSAWGGGHMVGDSWFHLTRIRFLLDHGLQNQDPYVEFAANVSIYHTNLYHAVIAAGAQLTQTDALTMWIMTFTWAKLVAFCGCYLLGWAIFERHWAAWIVALVTLTPRVAVTYLLYPNQLSFYWLLAMMMAFAIHAVRHDATWRSALLIAAGAFVLGQVHALYAFFAGLTLAPALAVLLIVNLFRKAGRPVATLACIAGLLLGAPFLLASRATVSPTAPAKTAAATKDNAAKPVAVKRTGFRADQYWHFENGSLMVKFNPTWQRLTPLALGVIAGLLTRRRSAVAVTVMIALSVAAVLYAPPVCTIIVDLLGELWILLRMQTILWVLLVNALTMGTLAYLLEVGMERHLHANAREVSTDGV